MDSPNSQDIDRFKDEATLDDTHWTEGLILQFSLRSRFQEVDNSELVNLKIRRYDRNNLELEDVDHPNVVFKNTGNFGIDHRVEGIDQLGYHVVYLFLEVNKSFRSTFPGAMSIASRYRNKKFDATFYVYL